LFGQGKKDTGSLAKSRLHFVLVQDRTGLDNNELASFKTELLGILEKYFVIDRCGFDIDYQRAGSGTTLVINSPVVVKRQESGGEVGSKRHKKGKPGAATPAKAAAQQSTA